VSFENGKMSVEFTAIDTNKHTFAPHQLVPLIYAAREQNILLAW